MTNTVFPLVAGGKAHFHDSQGDPLQGGLVYFYTTLTSSAKNTYSEYTGTTANTNPVELDSRGEADIYLLGDAAYKMVVKDSDGVTIYTRDPVYGLVDDSFLITPATFRQTIQAPLRNHFAGLTLSNNASDATNDIDIAVGECADSTGTYLIKLTSSITKRLDAAFAVGTGNGGLSTGSIANDAYHLHVIKRLDTGVVDVIFDVSATAPTLPTNYTIFRRLGAVIRAGATILPFTQFGDNFVLTTPVRDVNATVPGASAVTRTLASVPDGVRVRAWLTVATFDTGILESVYVSDLNATDQAPSQTAAPLHSNRSQVANDTGANPIAVMTNTSGQIRTRNSAGGANSTIIIVVNGWDDYREKNS
jgi:hypothetical protein